MGRNERLVSVEIDLPAEVIARLHELAGCTSRRRLDALASQLIVQAMEGRRL
jgi:outer membrane murein-binding lipoprotein Lpp